MGDGLTGKFSTAQTWTIATSATLAGGFVLSQTGVGASMIGVGAMGGAGFAIPLSSIGAVVSGGAAAVGAGFSSAAGAVAGVLAAIPVAGWIALAVIVVAAVVWYFWDDIKAFFTNLWKNFCNWFKATIVYDWIVNTAVPWTVDTASNVWDWVTDTAVPWVVGTATTVWNTTTNAITDAYIHTSTWADSIAKDIAKTADKIYGPWNVYDLRVNIWGEYNDYTKGLGFKKIEMNNGEIYKYGITRYNSVLKRYQTFQWIPKEYYIYSKLKDGGLEAFQWYLFRVSQFMARGMENSLIANYAVGHNGKFPPGNTGLY